MPTASATIAADVELTVDPQRHAAPRAWLDALAVALGCALTLAVHHYRFGEGNHTVYLLDALRRADPELLTNDWFVTQTLQYHAVFGWVARGLFELRLIEPAFLAGYLVLVVLFHVAWIKLVQQLGGGRGAYLVSLLLYYASAAGTGMGMYQFFQDSSFLPSNVANVAMLWAVYCWVAGRYSACGAWLGIAGIFHLNHAVVGVVMWVGLCAWEGYAGSSRTRSAALSLSTGRGRSIVIGSLCALGPAMLNILLAARVKLARSGSMSLDQFVDLYVRLRHPHHYDPTSWPIALWLCFLWPMPIAYALLRRVGGDPQRRRARQVLTFALALQLIALLGAGLWYVSEALVQMSLWRFSIFASLIACTVVAIGVARRFASPIATSVATTACAALIATCVIRGPFFGLMPLPGEDPEYLAVCDWARDDTPVDAVFLVPPGELSMRLRGRRAIVVNFKAVPQLSGELPEWRDRLQSVLHLGDLSPLPREYVETMRAMNERYASLAPRQLVETAEQYGARFIVTPRPSEPRDGLRLAFASPAKRYFVYHRRTATEERDP